MAIFGVAAWCWSLILLMCLSIDLEVSFIYSTMHFKSNSLQSKVLFQESFSVLSATLFILYIYLRSKNELSLNLFRTTSFFILAKVIFVICSFSLSNMTKIIVFFSILSSLVILDMALVAIWSITIDKSMFKNSMFIPGFILMIILAHFALLLGFGVLRNKNPIVFNCILIPFMFLAAYSIKKYKENRLVDIQETQDLKEEFSPSILCFLFIANLATLAPIRYLINGQYTNYSDLLTLNVTIITIFGAQLIVPFLSKNYLSGKGLICLGIVSLVLYYYTIMLEQKANLFNSLFFGLSLNTITFTIIPVKSWKLIDYEKVLVTKTTAKFLSILYIILGIIRTLFVFNLMLSDLDLILRMIITCTTLICLGLFIFIISFIFRFSKRIQKLVQVSHPTIANT